MSGGMNDGKNGNVQKITAIAQFSDLHVTESGKTNAYGVNTETGLRRCMARLKSMDTVPDVLVLSGDLVEDGKPAEYARLRDLLAEMSVPLFLLPGNHDRRDALRATFPERDELGRTGRIYHYRDVQGLRLIALDSVIEGQEPGDLDEAQLQWLQALLDSAPEQAAVLILHHPPVVTGFTRMDRISVAAQSVARLGEIVAASPQVRGIWCGHVHRSVQAVLKGAPVSVSPSTAFQAKLRLGGGRFEPSADDPPAFQMHYWNGRDLATHTVTA